MRRTSVFAVIVLILGLAIFTQAASSRPDFDGPVAHAAFWDPHWPSGSDCSVKHRMPVDMSPRGLLGGFKWYAKITRKITTLRDANGNANGADTYFTFRRTNKNVVICPKGAWTQIHSAFATKVPLHWFQSGASSGRLLVKNEQAPKGVETLKIFLRFRKGYHHPR